MKEYIALDTHKHYSVGEREDVATGVAQPCRITHRPGAIREFLRGIDPGTPVALETSGHWYWIADEIAAAGGRPALVHAYKAKVMFGCVNKTDRLDVRGLNRLQRAGTLPEVWLPPPELRDQRDLPRTRMFLVCQRSRLKCRILAHLARYGWNVHDVTDPFGHTGRAQIAQALATLPTYTQSMTRQLLAQYDFVDQQVTDAEKQIAALVALTPDMQRLMTLPGVGRILAVVITLEVGDVTRFAYADRLAAYAGTTPRVSSSGDRTRYGRLRQDVNRYLKWAFLEAANGVSLHRARHPERYVTRRYLQLARRKNHRTALGAVARHLAEAAWHVLQRKENYREATGGSTRT